MRSIQPITALAATTLLLGAWTSSFNTRASWTQSGDACALLTQAEVSAALGVAVDPGAPIIAANPRICGWAPPGGPKIDGKKLTVTLLTMKSFEAGKTPVKGIPKEPLTGVGDDAIQ